MCKIERRREREETERERERERERESLCVVQPEGFFCSVQHHLIKLCQRDAETAREGEKRKNNKTGR